LPDGPVTPTELLEDLSEAIDLFTEVAEERVDLLRLGNVFEQLSMYYRALGICHLSAKGAVGDFLQYLVQSALTRRHYLAGVAGGGEARYRRASFLDTVLDAMAARQWRLSASLFQSVAQTWTEGEEYEDDFCYADFLRRIATDAPAGIDDLLTRWEAVLEGHADVRLDVARAFVARSPGDFEQALSALLASAEQRAAAIADPVTGSLLADEETFFPNRWVSVEGLALLALAERVGIDAAQEFPACPPLARNGRLPGFRSKGYPNVAYVRE
jgi:hypothetical protein